MKRLKNIYIFLLVLIVAGCSPNSLEDYQFQGEALCRVIVLDLQKVHTREELNKALPRLTEQFNTLAKLIIEAKEYQAAHPGEAGIDPAYYEHEYAEGLKDELARICQLEGGRELIEKAQREALILLVPKQKRK
ncbi:MAG: hypothetical protein HYX48_01040 [Chlamydiales bacterium]|nr:hypothetical protein [Chlamydiales bacterium]